MEKKVETFLEAFQIFGLGKSRWIIMSLFFFLLCSVSMAERTTAELRNSASQAIKQGRFLPFWVVALAYG